MGDEHEIQPVCSGKVGCLETNDVGDFNYEFYYGDGRCASNDNGDDYDDESDSKNRKWERGTVML